MRDLNSVVSTYFWFDALNAMYVQLVLVTPQASEIKKNIKLVPSASRNGLNAFSREFAGDASSSSTSILEMGDK